jgi:hypothetical protein
MGQEIFPAPGGHDLLKLMRGDMQLVGNQLAESRRLLFQAAVKPYGHRLVATGARLDFDLVEAMVAFAGASVVAR